MWTSRNRARYDRSKLRYPSDVTDEEWELIVPLIPSGKSGGGKRTVIMREVVNGLMYVLSTGCQPQFGSCFENFVIRPKVSGQTLTVRTSRLPR
jgi:hypothetical protein